MLATSSRNQRPSVRRVSHRASGQWDADLLYSGGLSPKTWTNRRLAFQTVTRQSAQAMLCGDARSVATDELLGLKTCVSIGPGLNTMAGVPR